MLKLISPRRAEKILKTQSEWIRTVAARYGVPAAVIRAILYQEMIEIDLMDMLADLAVWSNLTAKKDSSTGYAQIFGRVGLNAVNFAADRGLTDYAALGIGSDHRLESTSREDVRLVWKLLHRDVRANIEIAALNLLHCPHTGLTTAGPDHQVQPYCRIHQDVPELNPDQHKHQIPLFLDSVP